MGIAVGLDEGEYDAPGSPDDAALTLTLAKLAWPAFSMVTILPFPGAAGAPRP